MRVFMVWNDLLFWSDQDEQGILLVVINFDHLEGSRCLAMLINLSLQLSKGIEQGSSWTCSCSCCPQCQYLWVEGRGAKPLAREEWSQETDVSGEEWCIFPISEVFPAWVLEIWVQERLCLHITALKNAAAWKPQVDVVDCVRVLLICESWSWKWEGGGEEADARKDGEGKIYKKEGKK